MQEFKKINLFEKRKMTIEELVKYYAEYRIYCYNKHDKLKGIELRKKIHFLINIILEIDKVISREENIIIGNENKDGLLFSKEEKYKINSGFFISTKN